MVGRVVDGLETSLFGDRDGFGTSQRKYRVLESWSHCSQPVRACSSQQSNENGFGLVVHGVPGGRACRENRLSSSPGPSFEIWSYTRIGPERLKSRSQLVCSGLDSLCLVFGSGSQPVIDMDRSHLATCRHREREQSERVSSS
jgi:hypothetical protein